MPAFIQPTMLQPKSKVYSRTLKDGIHSVFIASITETKHGQIIFKFSNGNGSISHSMDINEHLHKCLCGMAHLAGISGAVKLMDFINRGIEIEVINNKVRYITKYGQNNKF